MEGNPNTARQTGMNGESAAARWLENRGYTVLARNWRWGRGEIDLVAMDGATLVFAEVKTRRDSAFVNPVDCVSRSQRRQLYAAAAGFLRESCYAGEARFDLLLVSTGTDYSDERPLVEHFPDAFYGI